VNYWPYVAVFALLALFYAASLRNRRRQLAREVDRNSQITFGTEVMTTSGLYGTVVACNADDTVQLAIAPGVQVKWALAALRDVRTLPQRYRRDAAGTDVDPDAGPSEFGDRDPGS
jgi:preprotein translocase subunit YajC